jgi:hypothetical protein
MPRGRVLSPAFFSRKFTFPEKNVARPQAAASPALHSSFKLPGRASLTSASPGGPNPREQSAGQPSRGAERTIYSRISRCGERKLESARGRSLARGGTRVRCLARGQGQRALRLGEPRTSEAWPGQRACPLTVKVQPRGKKRRPHTRTPPLRRRRTEIGYWEGRGRTVSVLGGCPPPTRSRVDSSASMYTVGRTTHPPPAKHGTRSTRATQHHAIIRGSRIALVAHAARQPASLSQQVYGRPCRCYAVLRRLDDAATPRDSKMKDDEGRSRPR